MKREERRFEYRIYIIRYYPSLRICKNYMISMISRWSSKQQINQFDLPLRGKILKMYLYYEHHSRWITLYAKKNLYSILSSIVYDADLHFHLQHSLLRNIRYRNTIIPIPKDKIKNYSRETYNANSESL